MDNISFYKSFGFSRIATKGYHHTDNSKGITNHFLARMIEGRAEIVTEEGERLLLGAGDVFYLPTGLRYHSYWYAGESGSVRWDSFRFSLFPCKTEGEFSIKRLAGDEAVGELFDRIFELGDANAFTVGLFYQLLGLLMPQMEERAGEGHGRIMRRAVQYLEENPDCKMPELAKHCGVSESGLYALFRRYEGVTPIEMKNRIKIREAERLLRTTDLSVEEISQRLGFCNAGYFRKIFKRLLGVAPRDVKRLGELI